jgi:hypothetical protein
MLLEFLCNDCLRVFQVDLDYLEKLTAPKCQCGSMITCCCDLCSAAIIDLKLGSLGHQIWMQDGVSISSWTAEKGAKVEKFS